MRNINENKKRKAWEKWLYIPNPQPVVKNRVFCLHYAAVSAEVYYNWCFLFDAGTEVCCIQLPGRSTRSNEKNITVMENLVELISDVILSYNTNTPYVLFGHCMGGFIAHEITRYMIRQKSMLPGAVYVSGENPPHMPYRRDLHTLSDAELLRALREINFTPENFCFTEETVSEMLPILKGDFKLVDTWFFNPENSQIPVPIFAYGGDKDEFVTEANIQEWQRHTTKDFKYRILPGDHFFIKNEISRNEIIGDIKAFLKSLEI